MGWRIKTCTTLGIWFSAFIESGGLFFYALGLHTLSMWSYKFQVSSFHSSLKIKQNISSVKKSLAQFENFVTNFGQF